jgi:3-phosphoshikimate 1-carboxyvinyltransferase
VFATIACLKKLGVKISKKNEGVYEVFGKGLGSLYCKKKAILNCENSGTLARILCSILATTPGIHVKITGDASLKNRNMLKLKTLMEEFGAQFFPKNKIKFPLTMISSEMPIAIKYNAGVSAQLKSAVMFAGLNAYGNTKIIETKKSRDHTENMLLNNPSIIKIKKGKKNFISILGKGYLKPLNINIPGDPSASAFFIALTLLTNNSKLRIKNVGLNPTRIGFYQLIKKMGAKIKFVNVKLKNKEKIGDIEVYSSKLKPIKAGAEYYVSTTDEYPILFIVAALTPGISIFKGIGDLANKESNRIEEMKKILNQIGVKTKSDKDQIKIYGVDKEKIKKRNIKIPSLRDHRIYMSATILSLVIGLKTNIKNFETVKTSSPSFLKIINMIGGKFEIKK